MTSQTVSTLASQIEAATAAAIRRAVPGRATVDPQVRRSEHADFQANAALALAKQAGRPPRELAAGITDELDGAEIIDAAEVSGPGFINLTVTETAVWEQVARRLADPGLGIGLPWAGHRVVVDYSGPNVAKQMHVGHLRSTVIGDALARLFEAGGARVIRQNHVGDWGTQFGMLIQYLTEHADADWHHAERGGDATADIAVLDGLYRAARTAFDADSGFADRARARVVGLQSGDPDTVEIWRDLVNVSNRAFDAIYDRLGVGLSAADFDGESTHNDRLDGVADELADRGIAVESDGALCVFDDRFVGPDGDPVPMIVRKADGGYGYAATDLATIRHRVTDLKADRMLYVVDARQALHFTEVFATARRAGWLPDDVDAIHVAFGTVLGGDGKPFKTRSGGTVPLTDLVDAAVTRARDVVADKNTRLSAAELDTIAEACGVGAIKYADLSTSRTKDYRFDVDRMVALTGDTGVYLQYAHTRIAAILRKAGDDAGGGIDPGAGMHPAERALALHLDGYADALADTAANLEPHRLCGYLYGLAKTFTGFYESCPVLSADTPGRRRNRLALAGLSKDTLGHGLGLLGITAPEYM